MRTLFAVATLGVVALGSAQGPQKGLNHPVPKAAPQTGKSTVPVSCDEARATFTRVQRILGSVIGSPITGTPTVPEGTAPATRTIVVREMARQFQIARPSFKFIPDAVKYDSALIKTMDATQLANLRTLISYGCVAPIGPLAAGPKDTLTTEEFGDAIGFFLARLAQLTHTPSRKWTPALGAGGA